MSIRRSQQRFYVHKNLSAQLQCSLRVFRVFSINKSTAVASFGKEKVAVVGRRGVLRGALHWSNKVDHLNVLTSIGAIFKFAALKVCQLCKFSEAKIILSSMCELHEHPEGPAECKQFVATC